MTDPRLDTRRPGTVCTFYSYKGGVGRSMALANVGVVAAMEGRRVLLVDWDLEAPGLEMYFRKSARLVGSPDTRPGVVDLLEAQAQGRPLAWQECVMKAEFFGHTLDIISAGSRTDDYRRRVQQLNWEELFSRHQVGNYINELRDEWRAVYDIVLVDSRTGITDIGDICTVLLPDILVLMFVANQQNVEGICDAMERAVKARSRLPVNRSKLQGVPIPARDERDREYEKSLEWQAVYATAFGHLYREWLPKEVGPDAALNKLYIPYVAAWSFGERIPVIESERERTDPSSLGAAYTRLASLLMHRLDWQAIDGRASADELVGARLELSKAREAQRQANVSRQRARRWTVVAVLASIAVTVVTSLWYWTRPEPVSTDLFVGDRFEQEGSLSRALEVFQARRQLLEESAARRQDTSLNDDLATTYNRIGGVLAAQSKLSEAMWAFQAAKAIRDKLLTKEPENTRWQHELAISHDNVGRLLEAQGKLSEAMATFQAGKAVEEKLLAKEPEDTRWQHELAISHGRIGGLLEAQGKLSEAMSALQAGKAIWDKLLAKEPENTRWQDELAHSYNRIGDVLRGQRKLSEAKAAFQAGKVIRDKLLTEAPESTRWQLDLAVSHSRIGGVLEAQGDFSEAMAAFQVQIAVVDKLLAKEPENVAWQRERGAGLKWIGRLQLKMMQPDGAMHWLDRALQIASRPAVAALKAARRDMIQIQRFRVDASLSLGRLDAARDACRQGQQTAARVDLRGEDLLFWEPSIAALDIACAEVLALEGDRLAAAQAIGKAAARLRTMAARSPEIAEVRFEAVRAEQRAAQLQLRGA